MPRDPKTNPKRRIGDITSDAERARLKAVVRYTGNPSHKRNPGDFQLTPPSQPRADKSLCDEVEIFRRAEALAHLHAGIDHGLCSPYEPGTAPKRLWAVREDEVVLEAILENADTYAYHGYPLIHDEFRHEVLQVWRARRGDRV